MPLSARPRGGYVMHPLFTIIQDKSLLLSLLDYLGILPIIYILKHSFLLLQLLLLTHSSLSTTSSGGKPTHKTMATSQMATHLIFSRAEALPLLFLSLLVLLEAMDSTALAKESSISAFKS